MTLLDEIRMGICVRLLGLILSICPKKNTQGILMVKFIQAWSITSLEYERKG